MCRCQLRSVIFPPTGKGVGVGAGLEAQPANANAQIKTPSRVPADRLRNMVRPEKRYLALLIEHGRIAAARQRVGMALRVVTGD